MTEISKYITIIRPEFMAFCKDACRSATFNHLLFRIAGKSKDQPRENIQAGKILWYAKTELIASEMSDAWGVCKVRKEVNELLKMGLFGRKSNPTWGVDRTKHFFFGSEQCEVFLKYCEDNGTCVVHLDLPTEVKHLIYSSLANDRTIKCTCEKGNPEEANDKSIACIQSNHQMHSINLSPANDKSIEAITKTTTKTSNKDDTEEDTYSGQSEKPASVSAIASTAHAPSSQDEPYRPDFAASQASENETHSQLSTCAVEKPRQSAKLAPRQSKTTSEPKPKRPRTKAAPVVPEFTPEGRKVYDAWCSLFKSPPRVGPKTVECADALYPLLVPWCKELKLSCKDLLNEIKGQMYAADTSGFYKRGITLCDVERDFEKWQSAKTQEMERPKSSEPDDPISYTQRRLAAQRTLAKPKDSGMVLWHDSAGVERMMTYAEADENGWNGGFGEYIQHTHYGRTIV